MRMPWLLLLLLSVRFAYAADAGDTASADEKPTIAQFKGKGLVLEVTLDRAYQIIRIDGSSHGKDIVEYILAPNDGQSSGIFSLGKDSPNETNEGGPEDRLVPRTKITRTVNGTPTEWREWHGKDHLFGCCNLGIKISGQTDVVIGHIFVVANSLERREALENAFASMEIRGAASSQTVQKEDQAKHGVTP